MLETYSHVVGVYVIWTHSVRITVLQDDPGVIDLWEEADGVKKQRKNMNIWLVSVLSNVS